MPAIRLLPDLLINQIAAGEVYRASGFSAVSDLPPEAVNVDVNMPPVKYDSTVQDK
jgi:hypothetical protein